MKDHFVVSMASTSMSRGGIISEEHPVTLSRGLRQERVLVRF
jgi:hypothetical protein